MPISDEQVLAAIQRLRVRLAEYYDDDEAEDWMAASQPLLNGRSALACIRAGEEEEVHRLLNQLDDCVYL